MQRTIFAVPPLKELAMVDPEGGTRCTHFGSMYGRRIATSSEPLAGTNYLIEVVEVADRDHRVRVRRQTTGDYNTPAGLLPAELFVPQVSTHRRTAWRPRTHVRGRRRRAGENRKRPSRRGFAASDGEVDLKQIRFGRRDGGTGKVRSGHHPAIWNGSGFSRESQSALC